MNPVKEFQDPSSNKVLRAKFRMALWPLIMYLIALVWAYLSLPFVGHTSSIQNVIWSITAAGPFWIILLVFLVLTRRDQSSRN
jgi:predicted lysophospholipase L1 biosynthesis ABC-type transport system permease subunit